MDMNKVPMYDWNQMSVDDCVNHLKAKYLYSSSGDAKCIFELIKAYEQLNKRYLKDKQKDVIDAILSERDYQDKMVANTERPDMIEDLHVGDTIAAMQYNLDQARMMWYTGSTPHQFTMEYLRKIAALAVQAGEKYGMPYRTMTEVSKKEDSQVSCEGYDFNEGGCSAEECNCVKD